MPPFDVGGALGTGAGSWNACDRWPVENALARTLEHAGIETSLTPGSVYVRMAVDERGKVVRLRGEFELVEGGEVILLTARPLSESFRGNQEPPSFASGPTPKYVPFFLLLERTVIERCRATRRAETDEPLGVPRPFEPE